MDNELFGNLMALIKVLKKEKIDFPDYGTQNYHELHQIDEANNQFKLLINRKGHLREDALTYQMMSRKYGILVRLDVTGSPHDDIDGNPVYPPHVHIFDEAHNNGRWAVSLSEITDTELVEEIYDSLLVFLRYNNVDLTNISIPML